MNEDLIKNEILNGLLQIDSTFVITSISFDFNKQTRELKCSFTANTSTGETINAVTSYA